MHKDLNLPEGTAAFYATEIQRHVTCRWKKVQPLHTNSELPVCDCVHSSALNHWFVLDSLKEHRDFLIKETAPSSKSLTGASASINFKTCACAFVAFNKNNNTDRRLFISFMVGGLSRSEDIISRRLEAIDCPGLVAFPIRFEAQDALMNFCSFREVAASSPCREMTKIYCWPSHWPCSSLILVSER